MMLENGEIKIIDFDRYDFGDPWEEFNRIVWSAALSPHFATGQLRGYFGGEPPIEFFKLLAFYIASNTLSSIYWAIPFGQSDIDTMMKQAKDVLDWFENMQNPVPTWYLKDFYIQWADGVPYKLKKPFDFSFLKKYGRVFNVFDNQGSGNICFGISDNEKRFFIKFAGAQTEQYISTVESAIERLKMAVPAYQDCAHPTLIRFINAEEIGNGFAVIFDWVDAWCMHEGYPEDHRQFKQLKLENRLQIFEELLDFHAHAASKGYNAYDFYDASIMWDYINKKAVLCDIDFYSKSWYEGAKHMWNDSRWASPEECTNGATIDEISTVYNMGGAAFALFSNFDRSLDAWPLSTDLHNVVKKAVNDDRNQRQQSIIQLIAEWNAAK
jgi:serine/threonine-protein kinase